MEYFNIDIGPDGREVRYLHTDRYDFSEFGPKVCRKVSHVRFEDGTQEWVGRLSDGREIARSPTYAGCVDQERIEIDRMVAAGEEIPPEFNAQERILALEKKLLTTEDVMRMIEHHHFTYII